MAHGINYPEKHFDQVHGATNQVCCEIQTTSTAKKQPDQHISLQNAAKVSRRIIWDILKA